MTGPDTAGADGSSPEGTSPDARPDNWDDTRATLKSLFGQGHGEETPDAPAEASDTPEPTGPVPPPDGDAGPPPGVAPQEADDELALETLDTEGPTPVEEAEGGEEGLTASPLPAAIASEAAQLAEPREDAPQTEALQLDTEAEASPSEAAEAVTPDTLTEAPHSGGVSNDLEEQILAPSHAPAGPQVGQVVSGHRLNEDLGRGWFTASPEQAGPSVDVYARPAPSWAALRPHRLLPRFTQVGDLHVLSPVAGEPLPAPLPAAQALAYTRELAQLLFALEKQGYAVTDLDPDALRAGPEGLKLRFPPRVAALGQTPGATLRDGYTPPEVLAAQPAAARSGVYLLGALLYRWLTGQALPPEGPSPTVLGGVKLGGGPQLLSAMLAPAAVRLTPGAVLERVRALSAPGLPAYQVAAATNVGLNPDRPVNEDSYGFTWRQLGVHGADEVTLRACVSDGMGGMAAGEVASQAAVRGFLDSPKGNLDEMVWDANAAVLEAMAGRDGGCTISAVELRGAWLHLGHVGDTRAYLLRGGAAEQLSKDHSFVAAMVASGQMTPEQAQHSPDRNKVLRSLGSLRVPQPGYVQTLDTPLELRPGDRVLLVSDGVWGEVDDPVIHDLLRHERWLQALVDRLIDLALAAGAPDNATALVIERVK